MINRYSLADYTMAVKVPTAVIGGEIESLKFGGTGNNQSGSFIGQITVTRNVDTWSTEGDATGSWVHNKSLNKTGTVSLQIRQISDDIIKLITLARLYENSDPEEGCLITIYRGDKIIETCTDCYLTKVPDQVMGDTAEMQTWQWTCGKIEYNESTAF